MTTADHGKEPNSSDSNSRTPNQATRLVGYALESCARFYLDSAGRIVVDLTGNKAEVIRLDTPEVRRWFAGLVFQAEGVSVSSNVIRQALLTLEALARREDNPLPQEILDRMEANAAIDREAKVEGGSRRSQADRAIAYVLDSGAELFHDQHGDAFIAYENDQQGLEVWPLKSKAASNFTRWCFHRQEGKGLSGESLATARGTLAAQAQFQGVRRDLAVRVARTPEALYYDLGNCRAVRVTAEGWVVVDRPPILFRRYSHQSPQREPQADGCLDGFLDLVNLSDAKARLLLKVYLVAALLPDIPLPILLVYGEQGSAKSFLFRLLRALLDPSSLGTLAPPDSLREFVQQAAHHRTMYLDNLSSLPDWLSDALCRLCTGDGFSKRELYTDDDDVVYQFRGLGGLNGINLVATKSDLLDRAIMMKLEPIPDEKRLKEKDLWERFERMRSQVLGAMFDTLSDAVRRYPRVEISRSTRLSDFAHWGVAIAEALGHSAEEFLEAYGVNVETQNEAALEESPVAQAVLGFLRQGEEWSGTASQLLAELENRAEALHINVKARGWPKAANALARRLKEVAPNLRRVGVQVSNQRSGGVTTWRLSRGGGEKTAPIAPTATPVADSTIRGRGEISPPTVSTPPHGSTSPPRNLPGSYESSGSGDSSDISPPLDGRLESLLDKLDNALRRSRNEGTEGVRLEVSKLGTHLNSLGATVVIPLRERADPKKPFDQIDICQDVNTLSSNPNLAACVEPDYKPQDGEIVGVLRAGCFLGDRLVREAQVIVFKGEEYGEV